jgi:cytochrome P450
MSTSAASQQGLRVQYDPVPEAPPMISLDPPDHLRTRKLALQVFVPSHVATLEGKVR